jgi:hypothetical protein
MNSTDSRVLSAVGYVPFENIVGRAQMIFFSIAEGEHAWMFWRWPTAVRWNRLFSICDERRNSDHSDTSTSGEPGQQEDAGREARRRRGAARPAPRRLRRSKVASATSFPIPRC